MTDEPPYTEAETRRKIIDENLRLAGWKVDDPSQVVTELDILIDPHAAAPKTPQAEHRFADYALFLHGKPLAVVEAKKTSVDAQQGQEQALQYAQNIQKSAGGRMPLVFYTNGYDTFFWESEFYPPEKVHGFPGRLDLEWMDHRREERKPLSVELINTGIAGRDYQIAAIRSVLELVEAKRRKFLLVMATGTGKTRTAAALVDVLMRARWAKRVLFLVDRIALQEQALAAFKEHIPSEPRWPERPGEEFAKERRIYVTTYPTMLNLIQRGTTPGTWLSPFFFDLIVADESHRSIYNVYQQVLDYFHAIKLGLTATPKDQIDSDTFKLFDCGLHDPTFAYTYDEAIAHDPPYLCEFRVLKVRSKFQLEGIKGGTLPAELRKKLVAEGKDIEDIDFEGTDLERKVTNAGTNAVIVREFMEECVKDPSGTLPGKTIIFAISKAHARRLQEIFDKLYPEHAGKLARVLVSDDRFVHGKGGLLDQFKTRSMPRVAISVDMLDTGVDVLEVVNLVFAKPVYSRVKFWQMIGRGTRVLHEDPAKRKAWCPEKDKFLIIDYWANFEFFEMKPRGVEPGTMEPLPVRLFKARLDKLEAAVAAGRDDVADAVKADLRADLADLPANNVVVMENRAQMNVASADSFWPHLTAKDIGTLRTTIAPVLRARSGFDLKNMRFETQVVEAGTALLAGNQDAFEAIRDQLLDQIGELPPAVNIVAKEKALIDAVQSRAWWDDATDEKLRTLAERLAPLMRFRQRRTDPMMKLDLADLVAVKEWIEVGPHQERTTIQAYRERIEEYVRSLADRDAVLQKIRAGEPVSDDEVMRLAELLREHDPYATEDLLRKVYDHKTARFIQFIRHILGLEKLETWTATVSRAFDDFIARHNTFTALQIQFLQTLRTFILQTGHVERRHLVDPPFTQVHPGGIRGVFGQREIDEILEFVDEIGTKTA